MAPFGGFDHNAQAIKIVTSLERHYAEFDGLNLTWETLEGIAKHNGPVVGDLPNALSEYSAKHDLELQTHASAEAQVAAISDDVAYNNHDLDDGLRAGLFTEVDLADLPIVGACFTAVDKKYPALESNRRRHEALRRVFGVMVEDVIHTSTNLIKNSGANTAQDICPRPSFVFRMRYLPICNKFARFCLKTCTDLIASTLCACDPSRWYRVCSMHS